MSTDLTWQTVSTGSEATEQIGEQIGSRLKGGEVIELISDLGGGKTTFVCGLAKGMGSADKVASPSFTISREYHAGHKTLYHFDFYRLQDPGIVAIELTEAMENKQAVIAVEWSDNVKDLLPAGRLSIDIKQLGDTERTLKFVYPPSLAHLLPEKA